jgi:thioredoxin 1
MIKHITQDEYAEATGSGLKLVKFWAPWCTSCVAIEPVLQQVQEQIPSVDVLKINVEDAVEFCMGLGVSGLPALHLYKDGEVVWKEKGAKPFGYLVEKISPFV